MEREYNVGTWLTPSDEYIKDIKQTLVEKGLATELTPNEELSGVVESILTADELLKINPSLIFALLHTNTNYYDNGLTFSTTSFLTDELFQSLVPFIKKHWKKDTSYSVKAFYGCNKITMIPKEIDLNELLDEQPFLKTCYGCSKLTEFKTKAPLIIKGYAEAAFYNCVSITNIETLDFKEATNYSSNSPFQQCKALETLKIININYALQIGSGTSWGHLLTLESLINTCKECIKQSATRKLTVGTANLTKLADVYVKFTDSSVTSIAVGEKGDVVVCESTDEGAMTITEYMTLKSWTLA